MNFDKKRRKHTLHSLGVGGAFFALIFVLTKIVKGTVCPVKRLFDISCFGCGMTRGFLAILKLDFKSAYEYNVLSVPLFLGISIYSILALIDFAFEKDFIFIIEKKLSKKYMYLIYMFILVISTVMNTN